MSTTRADLEVKVEAAFADRDPALVSWPDPHPDRSPLEEEYSRLTDAAKWRIIGARADAWVTALVDLGLATTEPVEPGAIAWKKRPPTVVTAGVLVRPTWPAGLPLLIARSRMADIPDAGVTLGLGAPAVFVEAFPDCGCDACDSGADGDLERLDDYLRGIVTGRYRRLTGRRREIVVVDEGVRSWTGEFEPPEIQAILDDPTGWRELSGESWLA